MSDARRRIPSVERLLASAPFAPLVRDTPRPLLLHALQSELARTRARLTAGHGTDVSAEALAERVGSAAADVARGSLRAVINATGVVLHTNLGRAPLADAAIDAIRDVAGGYSTLEYDLGTGARGSRYDHCRSLLTVLTGAEDALVVNNNAAALVLALNTLSHDLEAIISRGELVEIGGAFRVPEIMARSGARLREVGATNRTHLPDYEGAVTPQSGVLLKVHPSNFTIDGYTAEVTVQQLAPLARRTGLPLVHDVGSGLLLPPASIGLPADEPYPAASLPHADVVTMSGDKLLGGPQCGIILGRSEFIDRMRSNPLCRALRVDKLTLAALAATLRLYLDPATAVREVPTLRMLTLPLSLLEQRSTRFAEHLAAAGVQCTTVSGTSAVGGGASPNAVIPTRLVVLTGAAAAGVVERRLRSADVPVIARIVDDRVALDLRTVPHGLEDALLTAVTAAVDTRSALK